MGDFFGGLRSGIQMPEVVMNQGPLPSNGRLPRPLHDTPDAKINYNSSLLGDLTPYAYGGPGHLSSQNAYLNIPHKIQKIVPVVYLPEAKKGATEFFDVSHPIDDGDIAFVLRLDRNSLFCTGLKNGDMRRAGLGTAVDPLINLCTLNYILSGMQLGIDGQPSDLWGELLFNLDKHRFGKSIGTDSRDYDANPLNLSDIVHMVRHCIKPFGVTRGSEKQGGQNEATSSPATWPVSFVVSLTIDGKESNVVNLWHSHDLSAGDDLVLRLKLMPLRPYTLNHYYKGVKRQNWAQPGDRKEKYVWQLVPDLLHIESASKEERSVLKSRLGEIHDDFKRLKVYVPGGTGLQDITVDENTPWQELGYWHVGRSQVMTARYGVEEYWHNDLANVLRTNHLDMTFQPVFHSTPMIRPAIGVARLGVGLCDQFLGEEDDFHEEELWAPDLGLERLGSDHDDAYFPADWDETARPPIDSGATEDIGELSFTMDVVEVAAVDSIAAPGLGAKKASKAAAGGTGKRAKTIGGSLLKADGTSEPSVVAML